MAASAERAGVEICGRFFSTTDSVVTDSSDGRRASFLPFTNFFGFFFLILFWYLAFFSFLFFFFNFPSIDHSDRKFFAHNLSNKRLETRAPSPLRGNTEKKRVNKSFRQLPIDQNKTSDHNFLAERKFGKE